MPPNQKEPREIAGLLFSHLLHHYNVAGLRTLGALFNIELDLLALRSMQVAETIALNSREMDENVLSAFVFDEIRAFRFTNCFA